MEYEVRLTTQAERDLERSWTYIAGRPDERRADAWRARVVAELNGLATMPRRFPIDPRPEHLSPTLRSFSVFSQQVVFEVDDDAQTVYVVRAWHNAREKLTLNE